MLVIRGSGEFVDNINWWFWNGLDYPGLLTRDDFSRLADLALSSEDRREPSLLLVRDSVVSIGTSSDAKSRRLEQLLQQLSGYLDLEMRASEGNSVICTITEFYEDAFDALKAYINVLESWGYNYGWYSVVDFMSVPSIVVTHKNRHLIALKKHEVKFVQGRPYRFNVGFSGASWIFDEEHGAIIASWRDKNDAGGSFKQSSLEMLNSEFDN